MVVEPKKDWGPVLPSITVLVPLVNVPFLVKLPFTVKVNELAKRVALVFIVKALQEAFAPMVTENPVEVAMTASSVEVGTTPPTQVLVEDQVPPVVVLVMALAGATPTITIITTAIKWNIFGWDIVNPLIQKRFKVFNIEKLIALTVRSSLVVTC